MVVLVKMRNRSYLLMLFFSRFILLVCPHSEGDTGDEADHGKPGETAVGWQAQAVAEVLGHNSLISKVAHHNNGAVVKGVGDDRYPQAAGPHEQIA